MEKNKVVSHLVCVMTCTIQYLHQLLHISCFSGSSINILLHIMLTIVSGLQEPLSCVVNITASCHDGLPTPKLTCSTALASTKVPPPTLASPLSTPLPISPPPLTTTFLAMGGVIVVVVGEGAAAVERGVAAVAMVARSSGSTLGPFTAWQR